MGSALTKRRSVPFFEISKEVEKRYDGSIGVLLEINGPGVLRRYEAEVLDDIVSQNEDVVIAAPGAMVSDGKQYEHLLQSQAVDCPEWRLAKCSGKAFVKGGPA